MDVECDLQLPGELETSSDKDDDHVCVDLVEQFHDGWEVEGLTLKVQL